MIRKAMIINKKNLRVLLILMLCLINLIFMGANAENQALINQQPPIKIEEGEIPLFGGVQSFRAVIGASTIGVLYGTDDNPKPLYLFTEFSQKLATVQIFNRRGTLERETELIVQNIFVFRLDSIVEFSDRNDDGLYNLVDDRQSLKMINLSSVSFHVSKNSDIFGNSGDDLEYLVNFNANNVSYERINNGIPLTSTLDDLSFTFALTIGSDQVTVNELPVISLKPQALGFEVSSTISNLSLTANRLISRLKFSCNIIGWDFASPKSRLLLKTTLVTGEQILTQFEKISGTPITRNTLGSIDIFSKLAFNSEQDNEPRQFNLDPNETHPNEEYSAYEFKYHRISLGSTLRNFLNLTWFPEIYVDEKSFPSVFQLFKFGGAKFQLRYQNPLTGLYLIGGFIFPQGNGIYYDPEIQLEELNPIFSIPKIPNRSILEENSLMILISGFFVGIVIIFRQFSYRRR